MPSITLLARAARVNYVYELRRLNFTPETQQRCRDLMFDIKEAVDALPEASECRGKMARAMRMNMALFALQGVCASAAIGCGTFGIVFKIVPLTIVAGCAVVLAAIACYIALWGYARKWELDAVRPWRQATLALLTPEKLAEPARVRKLTELSLCVKLREDKTLNNIDMVWRKRVNRKNGDPQEAEEQETDGVSASTTESV